MNCHCKVATVLSIIIVLMSQVGAFYHHGKFSDFYGEYFLPSPEGVGRVYTYCFDRRFSPRENCRPSTDPFHYDIGSARSGQPKSFRRDESAYDGRGGNINVGKGRFYRRVGSRDMVIECSFPRDTLLTSDVVWYRRSFRKDRNYQDDFRYHQLNRYRYVIETDALRVPGSRLVVRDYRPQEDDGVYRCFANRRSSGKYYGSSPHDFSTETVYMEIDVSDSGLHRRGLGRDD